MTPQTVLPRPPCRPGFSTHSKRMIVAPDCIRRRAAARMDVPPGKQHHLEAMPVPACGPAAGCNPALQMDFIKLGTPGSRLRRSCGRLIGAGSFLVPIGDGDRIVACRERQRGGRPDTSRATRYQRDRAIHCHRVPGPRTKTPAFSPVCSPFSSTLTPLTHTSRMPVESWCVSSKVARSPMVSGSNTTTSAQ
jgi:hypothetical protein